MKLNEYSYESLSKKIGVTKSHLYHIANGNIICRVDMAYKICKATSWQVDVFSLIPGVEYPVVKYVFKKRQKHEFI